MTYNKEDDGFQVKNTKTGEVKIYEEHRVRYLAAILSRETKKNFSRTWISAHIKDPEKIPSCNGYVITRYKLKEEDRDETKIPGISRKSLVTGDTTLYATKAPLFWREVSRMGPWVKGFGRFSAAIFKDTTKASGSG